MPQYSWSIDHKNIILAEVYKHDKENKIKMYMSYVYMEPTNIRLNILAFWVNHISYIILES